MAEEVLAVDDAWMEVPNLQDWVPSAVNSLKLEEDIHSYTESLRSLRNAHKEAERVTHRIAALRTDQTASLERSAADLHRCRSRA